MELSSPLPMVDRLHTSCRLTFLFALRPTHEEGIQSTQGFAKGRRPEASIVANPTEKDRPDLLDNVRQGKVVAVMQLPASHLLTHRLGCFTADRWGETDEQLPRTVLRTSGTKRVPQEIELPLRITAAPVAVLAVHRSEER